MALPTFYSTGTVSVLNGAKTVTGTGTGWGGDVLLTGDLFMDPAQPEIPPQRIASVTDGTHIELAHPWPGTTMAAATYEVRFVGNIERSTAQTRRYLEMLGQLSALGIQPNAHGEFTDRTVYDDAAKGFVFLSLDGDGVTDVWTLYMKLSAAAGDWDAGQQMAGAEGEKGDTGEKGDRGDIGRGAGLYYRFDNATTGDPGAGHFGFNNATVASVTNLRISETDGDGIGLATLIATFDDSTTTAARGVLMLRKVGDPTVFAAFQITSALTDSGAYDSFTVAHLASGGAFVDEDEFTVEFYRTGNTGTNGSNGTNGASGGVTFTYSTTTADADPGNGAFRLNHATLASATKLYIDNQDTNAVSMTAWLDSFDDSTSVGKGVLIFKGVTQPSAIAIYKVTGSVVDGAGYRKVDLTYVTHGGTWTNGNTFSILFIPSGDKGTDGLGAGDVIGPAGAINNRVAVFDGLTGKLLKDGGSQVSDFATAAQGAKADTAVQPGSLGDAATKNTGTAAGTVAAGNDSRIAGAIQSTLLTARGDILVRDATGPTRLAKGTQYQVLQAGATDPVYGAVNLAQAAAVTGILPAANLPDATQSAKGVSQFATAALYRAGTDTARSLVVDQVWAAAGLAVLTDAATITVDLSAGFYFGGAGNAPLALGGNRDLGAPTNVSKNQAGVLWFGASGATRTLTLNAAWKLATGVEAGPYSITTSQELGVAYVVRGSDVIVTAILRRG